MITCYLSCSGCGQYREPFDCRERGPDERHEEWVNSVVIPEARTRHEAYVRGSLNLRCDKSTIEIWLLTEGDIKWLCMTIFPNLSKV